MEKTTKIKQEDLGMHINHMPLPQYKCHKRVWALKIKSIEEHLQVKLCGVVQHEAYAVINFEDARFSPITWDINFPGVSKPEAGWYYVVYEDGYRSFSPEASFESGYDKMETTQCRSVNMSQENHAQRQERIHAIFNDLIGLLPATKYKIKAMQANQHIDTEYKFGELDVQELSDARIYARLFTHVPQLDVCFNAYIHVADDGSLVINTSIVDDGVKQHQTTASSFQISSSIDAAEKICSYLYDISCIVGEQVSDMSASKKQLNTDTACVNTQVQEPKQAAQQIKIAGYRELSIDEIELMNRVKAEGVVIGELVEKLQDMKTLDQRWVSIGKTDLQTGLMALVRSIAQPTTF